METQMQNPSGQSMQGRRPRWTEEEDAFLAQKRREGLSKRDILTAYRQRFPTADRPDAGIMARIPTMARAMGKEPVGAEAEERFPATQRTPLSLGERAERIFGLIEELPQLEQSRVLIAVGTLCGLDITTTAQNGSGYTAARSHQA